MTSRDTTRLLALPEKAVDPSRTSFSDIAHRLAFGAIGWPWLLFSLWGGTRASKKRLLERVELDQDSLPNLGSWKADTGFLHRIVDAIEELRPQVVVELGAGASTLVCAKALALNGGGRLISFDQHRDFVEATARWIKEEGTEADLRWAPLSRDAGDWPGRWYCLDDVPDHIDLLIIDGPPWAVHPFVRGAAECLFDRLSPQGRVLLDDAARPGERVVARRWRKNWPGMSFERANGSTKGTLVGRKLDASQTPQPHITVANDNQRPGRWRRAAAILALFGAGWMANEVTGDFSEPARAASIVDEAHASHTVSRARLAINSLSEAERRDRRKIAQAIGLGLPNLPAGWEVNDVQIYPSDLGNSLSVTLITGEGESLSLFAVRAETAGATNYRAARKERRSLLGRGALRLRSCRRD